MTRPGTDRLVLVRATADEAAGAARKVAGLTVLERSIKQLLRAGYDVAVASDDSMVLPPVASGGGAVALHPIAGPAAFEELRRSLAPSAVVYADVVRPGAGPLGGGIRVVDRSTATQAEDAIFAELLRGDLGLVARYLNKPVSFWFTRHVLCHLPVTPNQVTLGAAVIALVGCALLATGVADAVIAGLFLAHVQSVLDGCDGELARVRFQQSAIGEWLDTVVDDGLNLAIIFSLGLGQARAHGNSLPLWVGLAACGMLFTYNVVAYRELARQGLGGEVLKVRWWFARGNDLKKLYGREGPGLFRMLTAIGRRDFFVLAWLLLAVVGLVPVVLLYALTIAAASFVVAVGQLLQRRSSGSR